MRMTMMAVISITLVLGPGATDAAGQFTTRIALADVAPTTGLGSCVPETEEEALAAVLGTRTLDREEAKIELLRLQEALATASADRPDDVDLRYALATVFGSRANVEGGRTRVKAAQAMYTQALRVLELDPDHAGAHHLLGRLHAGVMRMDRISRFVATRLLGGGALAGASWSEARVRLEAAVVADPCVPDHHFELARLYAERGQPELAIERLERLDDLTPTPPFADTFERASELLEELLREGARR